ncbi:hypothetical protein BS50DRAFT_594444 [Corynespora cassiicola Philippines]|uniref:Uncharacterized protein n=1 Tax=Corynespora cassiicola Philippines TaxID=1448308 RepID=A0A2T2N2E2_CORCC|nr:hypothetical protein BS50DRAFT_594444 [Corynespora cassiicola Philippines]
MSSSSVSSTRSSSGPNLETKTVPVELIDRADNKTPHNTWFMRMMKRIWLPSRSKHRNQQKEQQISAIMTLKYIEAKQEKLENTMERLGREVRDALKRIEAEQDNLKNTTERLGTDVRDALGTAERIYSYLPDIEYDN